ncbi:MAG: bifunctional phosphoglucose/phosphomannose isomerase [Candidatus Omnitrophota bacterium]
MTHLLDNPDFRKTIDPQDMLGFVESFREQCVHGEALAREFILPHLGEIDRVVVCGMGGSAIGGDLLRAYANWKSPISIEIARNYSMPHSVGLKTLVIVSSYSGNTEETLSAYEEAKERGAFIQAITTGGEISRRCVEDGCPRLEIPSGYSPRAALGYSFLPLLVLFERWGWIENQTPKLAAMYKALEESQKLYGFDVPYEENPAKRMAEQLKDSIPVIYAGQDAFQPVAVRWRSQFNENAKTFAHDSALPEMNHNEILGWSHPQETLKHLKAIYLLDEGYHPQTLKRFQAMKQILAASGTEILEWQSRGEGLLARMMSTIHFGDYVSVYLAYLYHQDPTPIPAIDYLKAELAK